MPPATPHKALNTALATHTFPPVFYLHGDDDFQKDDAVRQILAAAVDPATRDFNLETVRGAEVDAGLLGSLLGTPPMMAERRAVVLRDPGALKKDARAALDRYLDRPAADTVLVLVAPAGAKVDRALLTRAGTGAYEFAPLREDRLLRWIAHHASTALDARITPEAARLLQGAVGNDLPQLAAELDKLASYARGDSAADAPLLIDEDAVSAIVGVRRGETLADLLDAVAQQDARRAAGLVPHVLSLPKSSAVTAVMALATQMLALAWGEARRARGASLSALSGNGPDGFMTLLKELGNAYTGRPWGEAVRAWTGAVDRWTPAALDRALEQLLQTDVALKETGVSSDAQLLTTLVLSLCALPQVRSEPLTGRR